MSRKLFFYLSISMLLYSCSEKKEHPTRMELSENWSLTQESSLKLISDNIHIPTTVHSDLMDAGIIPDPFVANNEEKVGWVAQEEWSYSTDFGLSREQLRSDHLYLNFDGFNTYADVFLNDSLILKNTNAFIKSRVNVNGILKEKNQLKVTFKPTTPFEIAADSAHPYTLPLTTADNNHRVFTRKGQFEYGWDWGPALNTMGFSRPVYLDIYNGLKIKDVYLKQNRLNDSIASLDAQIELEESAVYEDLQFDVYVNEEKSGTLNYGTTKKTQTFNVPFTIAHPKKWWPHNLGDPYRYDIKIIAHQDGIERDQWSFKKGLRTIELVNEQDSIGESFYFKVNGVPVYAKGANYIPQNSMQNLVKPADYERLLSDAVAANMNFLRVWGGGNYEEDLFYETCDEKGILVWQDFMFAGGMYPADKRFRESVKTEASQQVKRLRNHSSVVLFNGNNEISEGWHRWGWQGGRTSEDKEYLWNDYKTIFQDILPTAVKQYSDIPYWETSPMYGRGDARYETHGNSHDWWVWHDGVSFEHYEEHVPRFSSEFGFQSHPSYETIWFINEDGSTDINSADYATHQKHSRGKALIQQYMERNFPVPSIYEDYVYVSQLLQAYGVSKGINAQRRARPRSMGTLYWQLNDCWPAVSWSSIDYCGNWKALHYQAKRDFENVLLSTHLKENMLSGYIVNDNLNDITGNYSITIKDFNGIEIHKKTIRATAKAGSSKLMMQLDLDKLDFDPQKVYVVTEFASKKVIDILVKPKDLKLSRPEIQLKSKKTEDGYKITLKTDVFAKDVFVIYSDKGHFSDNFFDLEPNKEKIIYLKRFTTGSGVLQVKTLNELIQNAKLGI